MPPTNAKMKALTPWFILKYCGPQWVLFRLSYAFKQRSGWLRRQTPISTWDAQPLSGFLTDCQLAEPEPYLAYRRQHRPPFGFASQPRAQFTSHFAAWDSGDRHPVVEADRLQKGDVPYFGHAWAHLGYPPQWHVNPFTEQQLDAKQHWSCTHEFAHGDIKVVREPSRFGFVYGLVRAYWRTGDIGCVELFWQMVELATAQSAAPGAQLAVWAGN